MVVDVVVLFVVVVIVVVIVVFVVIVVVIVVASLAGKAVRRRDDDSWRKCGNKPEMNKRELNSQTNIKSEHIIYRLKDLII